MIKNLTNNDVLATQVKPCTSFWARLKGLLGTRSLGAEDAFWITPCNSIHTIGMNYSIDAYFLNKAHEVVAIQKNMQPYRLSPIYRNAFSVLEFKSGARNCRVGDKLAISNSSPVKKKIGSKGQATVEFAITFIIFVAMMVGLSEISRICYSWVSLQFATSEGGRQAMLGSKTDTTPTGRQTFVVNTIRQKAATMGLHTPIDVTFFSLNDVSLGATPGASDTYVEVRAKTKLRPLPLSEAFIGWTGDSYKQLFNITARTVVKNEPFS